MMLELVMVAREEKMVPITELHLMIISWNQVIWELGVEV